MQIHARSYRPAFAVLVLPTPSFIDSVCKAPVQRGRMTADYGCVKLTPIPRVLCHRVLRLRLQRYHVPGSATDLYTGQPLRTQPFYQVSSIKVLALHVGGPCPPFPLAVCFLVCDICFPRLVPHPCMR